MTPDDPRHGTYAGYRAHCKAAERVCDACRAARNEYKREHQRTHYVPSSRIADRLEDLRWMTDTGETAAGAAKRLGITLDALEKWCARHAQNEWRRLRAREVIFTHNGGANQYRQEAC